MGNMIHKKHNNNTQIKMIGLDLDGTTLAKRGLTKRTKKALENVIKAGVHVVIATGRSYAALPESIFHVKGLRFLVTSNGAQITDLKEGKVIYSNCISREKIMEIADILRATNYVVEIFTEGHAYIDRKVYDELKEGESSYLSRKYILKTRIPVDGILDFLAEHSDTIENINVIFQFQEDKLAMKKVFEETGGITVTSSMKNNIELGGDTTSKASAIKALEHILGVGTENMMACGDSHNDMEMLKEAGFAVAMGNAEDEVKEAADFVAPSNDEEGVAYVIEKFALGKKPDRLAAFHKVKNMTAAVFSKKFKDRWI